jgi:hypothetical protein
MRPPELGALAGFGPVTDDLGFGHRKDPRVPSATRAMKLGAMRMRR